jgi:hypothetical protein
VFAPHVPCFADPGIIDAAQRQHISGRNAEPAFEHQHHARARGRIEQLGIADVDIGRQLAFLKHPVNRILVGGLHMLRGDAERRRYGVGKSLGVVSGNFACLAFASDQVGIAP